jgi:hypothetical protein
MLFSLSAYDAEKYGESLRIAVLIHSMFPEELAASALSA